MAVSKISGKDVGLYVNEGTTEASDWKLFACSTTDGFSGTTDSVQLASKCDGDFVDNLPTNLSWEFSNSSYAVKDPDLSEAQVSYSTAFNLWVTKSIKEFKIANADESYLRQGQGFISSLSDSADEGDALTFDITITGVGAVTDAVTT